MTPRRSRLLTLAIAASLAGPVLAAAPATSATSAPVAGRDTSYAVAGADWLVGGLTDGLPDPPDLYPDRDASLAIGRALQQLDGDRWAATLDEISDAVTDPEAVEDYLTPEGERPVAPPARLLAFTASRGLPPPAYRSGDVRTHLESLVADEPPIVGRLQPRVEGRDHGFVENQSQAHLALATSGSGRADDVRRFLLKQQCRQGYYRARMRLSTTDPDQTCDGGAGDGRSPGDPSTTAVVVLHLLATDPPAGSRAAASVVAATDWLARRLDDDGLLRERGGRVVDTGVLGVVAEALASRARHLPQARALAAAVADRQVQGLACEGALAGTEDGAVAPDRGAFDGAVGAGPIARPNWLRATASAVPALRLLPEPTGTPGFDPSVDGTYVRAGAPNRLGLTGLDPGAKVCVEGPGGPYAATGPGHGSPAVTVDVPAGPGDLDYALDDSTVSVTALPPRRLAVDLGRQRARRGAQQAVTVRGLAPGERVTVRLRDAVVVRGAAADDGAFRRTFRVSGRPGRAPVRVTGQFAATRSGTASFRVL